MLNALLLDSTFNELHAHGPQRAAAAPQHTRYSIQSTAGGPARLRAACAAAQRGDGAPGRRGGGRPLAARGPMIISMMLRRRPRRSGASDGGRTVMAMTPAAWTVRGPGRTGARGLFI